MSSSTSEANSRIFLDIQKLHEVPIPTNQEPSQSEIPTSGYDQNIEGCALWTARSAKSETDITPSFGLGLR